MLIYSYRTIGKLTCITLYIASVMFLVASGVIYHHGREIEEYIPCPAHIENIDYITDRENRRTKRIYYFDVVWEKDGEIHRTEQYRNYSPPEEDFDTVYVSPDGSDISMYDSTDIIDNAARTLLASMFAGLLGVLFHTGQMEKLYYKIRRVLKKNRKK